MKVKVINTSGAETGKEVTLPQDIFGVEPNDHAIYLDVKQYLANQRQGTHSSTEKGDVKGSTRKMLYVLTSSAFITTALGIFRADK